jgi:hypothetical protein
MVPTADNADKSPGLFASTFGPLDGAGDAEQMQMRICWQPRSSRFLFLSPSGNSSLG